MSQRLEPVSRQSGEGGPVEEIFSGPSLSLAEVPALCLLRTFEGRMPFSAARLIWPGWELQVSRRRRQKRIWG